MDKTKLLEAKASFCLFKELDFEHALVVLKKTNKDIDWLTTKFYDYLHDTCFHANNVDVINLIYTHIFDTAAEELEKHGINIIDMNFSIYGNYLDTQFDFFYDSVENLNDEIKYNKTIIKNLKPETVFFLEAVGIKED